MARAAPVTAATTVVCPPVGAIVGVGVAVKLPSAATVGVGEGEGESVGELEGVIVADGVADSET